MNQIQKLEKYVSFYKLLLHINPKNFNEKYRSQMIIIFKDLYKLYCSESKSIFYFWIEIITDTLYTALQQHLMNFKLIKTPRINNPFIASLLIFIVTYVIVSSLILIVNLYQFGGLGVKHRLSKFVEKHHDVIENKIFGETFEKAVYCLQITDVELKDSCEQAAGRTIGDNLPEEELAGDGSIGWPNDLFFIKQDGKAYYVVGWDGSLKNITPTVNVKAITQSQPLSSIIFHQNCKYFGIWPANYSCEIYELIKLSNENKGYIVRNMPLDEDSDLLLIMISPIIMIPSLISEIVSRNTNTINGIYYVGYYSSNLLVALLVSILHFHFRKKT